MNFLDEIKQQPEALRTLNRNYRCGYRPLKQLEEMAPNYDNFVFTGMGSSLFVGYVACSLLNAKGIKASAIEAGELSKNRYSMMDDRTLLIAISQSGESTEVITMCNKLSKPENLVTVTNYRDKTLYSYGVEKFEIFAGEERTTANKTYTNSIATLIYMAYAIGGMLDEKMEEIAEEIEKAADVMQGFIDNEEQKEQLCDFFFDANFVCMVGSGASYCTASHGQLIIEEAAKKFATRYTTSQFIHGPVELIRPDFTVLILDNDENYRMEVDRIIRNVIDYEGRVCLITNRDIQPESENMLVIPSGVQNALFAPLVEILPVELMINAVGTKKNQNPGIIYRVKK